MYLTMLTITLFSGCQDKAAQEENAKLAQKVADVERTRDRLQADKDALKARLDRVEADAAVAKKAKLFEKVGYKPGENKITATIHTTMGDVHCTLRPDEAPESVLNFIQLSMGEKEWTTPNGEKTSRPLYDGTIFHRVIPGFMAQGGDPAGNGSGGPGYEFADEVGSFTTFDHTAILAMANRGPNTQGSQFFITDGTPTHLNGKHTILGDCEDLDTVKAITSAERDGKDKPLKDIVLKHVDISVR